ncbi:hypothetical protein LINPERHAP2_LOCUS41239 [Linum perenne]
MFPGLMMVGVGRSKKFGGGGVLDGDGQVIGEEGGLTLLGSSRTFCAVSEVGGFNWRFRDSGVTRSLELRLTNRQDRWNQDDETNVLGQNSESSFRLSLSFQLDVS